MPDQPGKDTADSDNRRRNNRKGKAKERRPTGVVVLPPSMREEDTEELRIAKQNAMENENIDNIAVGQEGVGILDMNLEQAMMQMAEYESAIREWETEYNRISDELTKSRSEVEKLASEVKRLRGENENLLAILKRKPQKPSEPVVGV